MLGRVIPVVQAVSLVRKKLNSVRDCPMDQFEIYGIYKRFVFTFFVHILPTS